MSKEHHGGGPIWLAITAPAPILPAMRQAWSEFLRGVPAGRHGVEIYSDERDLTGSVARFLAAGFERGEPAIVVATEPHTLAFRARLSELGWTEDRVGSG